MMARLRVLPRSSSRATPLRPPFFFSSSSSLSLYFLQSLLFISLFTMQGGGDDYRRRFTAPPASTPPSGDHGLLSRQLNASRLKEGPFFLPPLFVCFFLLHACHLVSALLVVLLYPFSFFCFGLVSPLASATAMHLLAYCEQQSLKQIHVAAHWWR
jgi:hypothetical protein